jgi:hypothetical protein
MAGVLNIRALLVILAVGAAARGDEPGPTLLRDDDPSPAVVMPAAPECQADNALCAVTPCKTEPKWVWGIIDFSGVYAGSRMAPNGVPFDPLFSLEFDFNLWLWRSQGLYMFTDTRFWAQRAGLGVTNPDQKIDFSKREYDFDIGSAWNYAGPLEFRTFGYSLNNLNRGQTLTGPYGYKDGFGVENRLYLTPMYLNLGTDRYDIARADFVSLGYLPTKELVGGNGERFFPSVFARAYLTQDLWPRFVYAYLDVTLFTERPVTPKLLVTDAGLALRPLKNLWRLEFRAGCENYWDVQDDRARPLGYLSVRFVY